MRNKQLFAGVFAAGCLILGARSVCAQQPPEWAYPRNPAGFKGQVDNGTPRRVPDSTATYTLTQLRDRFLGPDWHPEDHPAMPQIVSQGRKPDVLACGFCHRADGPGGPENANLSGLTAAYIERQMRDYKNGLRRTAVAGRNIDLMISLAKAASDEDIRSAAAYFASVRPKSIVRVVEADSIPRTYITGWHFATMGKGEEEALGRRIIEVPEHFEHFESRDSRARFIAYVPKGSLQNGRTLATDGGGKTVACAACHGDGLRGTGDVPGIAGRSPTYLFRQLFEFKHAVRAGAQSEQMKPTVANLGEEDMIALSAYAASLPMAVDGK